LCGNLTIPNYEKYFHCFLIANKVKLRHSHDRPSRSDFVQSVFVEEKSDEESNNDIDYCNKISKDGYYKPEEIVLMPIPGSGSKEFLFCVKMYCEM
jgi:hypothetical protein